MRWVHERRHIAHDESPLERLAERGAQPVRAYIAYLPPPTLGTARVEVQR